MTDISNAKTYTCKTCSDTITLHSGSHETPLPRSHGWVEHTPATWLCYDCKRSDKKDMVYRQGEWYYWNIGEAGYTIRVNNDTDDTICTVRDKTYAKMIIKAMNDTIFSQSQGITNCTAHDTQCEPGEWYVQKSLARVRQEDDSGKLAAQNHKYAYALKIQVHTTHPEEPASHTEAFVNDEALANTIVKFMNEDRKNPVIEGPKPHGTFYSEKQNHHFQIKIATAITTTGFLYVGTIHGQELADHIIKDLNDNYPIEKPDGLWYTDYSERGTAIIQHNRQGVGTEHGIIHGKEQAEKIAYYLNKAQFAATPLKTAK